MTKQAVNLPLRPTALIAAINFITIGAMKALQEVGMDDIALVGFDDLPPAMVTFPFFTVASAGLSNGCAGDAVALGTPEATVV